MKPSVGEHSILWRRLDRPGHEFARLYSEDLYWLLAGTAAFAHEEQACRLDYLIRCDHEWRTVSCQVTGWLGNQSIEIEISVDSRRQWELNGTTCDLVSGSLDVDLNFSPSTNLLPIRRLGLSIGEQAEVQAAWLRFPSFRLEPLDQRYQRLTGETYRYQSAGGSFVTDLEVNSAGFVTRYPNFCDSEVYG